MSEQESTGHGPDSGDAISESPSLYKERKRIAPKHFGIAVVIAIIIGALLLAGFYFGTHAHRTTDTQKMRGTVVLSEKELRDLVVSNQLTVYWTGPIKGDKYSLFVPKTGIAIVRYLPGGRGISDAAPLYRLVATYVQKDAFSTTRLAGTKVGNLGFVNIDGNSVFYVKARPTNVYVGLKNKDVQIEIFDPGQDQAVALSLFRGQIQQVN